MLPPPPKKKSRPKATSLKLLNGGMGGGYDLFCSANINLTINYISFHIILYGLYIIFSNFH